MLREHPCNYSFFHHTPIESTFVEVGCTDSTDYEKFYVVTEAMRPGPAPARLVVVKPTTHLENVRVQIRTKTRQCGNAKVNTADLEGARLGVALTKALQYRVGGTPPILVFAVHINVSLLVVVYILHH
jgi:hypothetical protein